MASRNHLLDAAPPVEPARSHHARSDTTRSAASSYANADRESRIAVPSTLLERVGAGALKGMERLVSTASLVGDRPIFETSEFPWIAAVEADWRAIRDDLDRVQEHAARLPNFQDIATDVGRISNDDQWKTFFFTGLGQFSERNCQFCPATARALRRIPGLMTAFFSILAPGKRIPEHRGPYNGVLRYHLGLRVPAARENCWIRVGDEVRHWAEGESLVFDDSFNHEVHNDTDEYRAILFVDFLRPLRFPVSTLNRTLLTSLRHVPMLRRSKAWHEAWEESFHADESMTAPR